MRIELTFPCTCRETPDLKSGTGTSSVTSPEFYRMTILKRIVAYYRDDIGQMM